MLLQNHIFSSILDHIDSHQQPFYLYFKNQIQNNCNLFKQIPYENKSIHFATMANINKDFLKIVKDENISVFVNSMIHLQATQSVGFKDKDIIFTASAMDLETMKYVKENGIHANLDSLEQFKTWERLFPGTPAGIRCNIGDEVIAHKTHAGYFIGKDSRLGLTIDEIKSLEGNSNVSGLHMYVGTDISDIEYFLVCYEKLSEYASLFPQLEYLNFGGGFGIEEDGKNNIDFKEYGIKVRELMNEVSKKAGRSIRLILEPGRIIGGNSGYFICKVSDVKKRDNQIFTGVNASTVQFPRPLMYPDVARHPVAIIRKGKQVINEAAINTSIYGCSTYSRDYFLKDALLPETQIGDILVFGNAGSYSASSYLEFLGFPKPAEYFI